MPGTDRELFDLEALRCAGAALGAGLADRRPFALPGDQSVWGRDRPIDVQHLRVELDLDVRARRVRGLATITFRPRNDGLREAVFDAVELDVEAVTDERGRALPFSLADRTLRVDLGRARSSRRAITAVVRYSCRPRRGLYFNRPDAGYPDRPQQVWTQGQAEDSPYYFPCFDFPGAKQTTELIATVPAGWFALSNGRLAAVRKGARRSTYHWVQDRPHPAYLVTLAAGEMDSVEDDADGVPVQYYGPKGSAAGLRRAFGRTPEMIRFFSDKIGVPYPWAKYATVAVADFIFGGMENTSATTMTDTLLHDERAHPDFQENADSITAHELAHQWFGDLLTCREWAHGWLNESFATYFDALFVEHQRGWDAFRYDLSQKAQVYFEEDSKQYRRPLVQHVYREPIDIFDRHLYERGAQVLDMIRYQLGDELWWKAIHRYVAQHAGSDVITADFQRAIEEATGRNLDWFFDQWVWKGGHPEFKATYSWDAEHRAATVKLSQTQTPDEHLTSIYRTPLEIGFMTARGWREFRVEVSEREHAFVFPLDGEPRFVAIDPANRVLKSLSFEPGERQLRARLSDDPQAMGRIEAAKGLAKLGSPAAIDALHDALQRDAELSFVRAEIAAALGSTRAEAARDALIGAAAAEPSRVRRAVATALGSFPDAKAARALQRYLAGGGDRSYYVQAAAAGALGKTLQPSAFAALRRVLDRPAHNDVITSAALGGLAALRDARSAPILLDYTAWGRHQNARRAAVDALGRLAPLLEEPERTRVRERLEQLLDDRWLRVQLGAASALAELKDIRSAGPLGAAAGRALDGRLRRQARIAARAIAEGADRGEDVKRLQDEMEKLRQAHQQLKDRFATLEARLGARPAAAASGGPTGAAPGGRRRARQ
ncbi:MAG: hypothetical protein EXR65_02340 [Dehalococcoidia bacterium]|nr:hypothetical protein [Dehalococcoidia bacterium]